MTFSHINIGAREIGPQRPVYIIAEMSANHGGDYDQAVKILEAAKAAGADAIKLQTYTPETMTLPSNRKYFQIRDTIWGGATLHDLYQKAQTPWEWHAPLQRRARELSLDFFSTPFDASAVDFLKQLDVPAYKIASFELVDLPLLRRVAETGKPVIISTGMATLAEIEEAVATLQGAGCRQLALLKCTSAYPTPADQTNLRTIPHLAGTFGVPIGFSDHTLDTVVPVTAVALGATILEKHITLSRARQTPDSAFSLEASEFKAMVSAIRTAEAALGSIRYGPSKAEIPCRIFRRSLFVAEDIKPGERFTERNLRCIRPAHGLHPRNLPQVLGKRARCAVAAGTPLSWELIDGNGELQ